MYLLFVYWCTTRIYGVLQVEIIATALDLLGKGRDVHLQVANTQHSLTDSTRLTRLTRLRQTDSTDSIRLTRLTRLRLTRLIPSLGNDLESVSRVSQSVRHQSAVRQSEW